MFVRGLTRLSKRACRSARGCGRPSRRKLIAPVRRNQTSTQHAVPAQQSITDWRSNLGADDAFLHGPRDESWWTGPPRPTKEISSLPFPDCTQVTRADLKEYFDNSWQLTETLFSALQGEEAFMRPPYHDLRHPLIFYYGHPACFYVNKLRLAGLLDKPVHPYFESIFEVGVDEMRWDDLSKNHMEWPSVAEVHAYRKAVYPVIVDAIMNAPGFETLATELQNSAWWSMPMGFEHERIHIETSSVLMRELPIECVRCPEAWPQLQLTAQSWENPVEGTHYRPNELIKRPTATVHLGKSVDEKTYGWDNEYGSKSIAVPHFKASKMQVSNGEFYQFVVSGGYRDPTLWSVDGWSWACFRNVRKPTFWVTDGPQGLNQYKLRTVFTEEEMQWDWPVIVNYHEAKAFCSWKTRQDDAFDKPYRVLTEAEHWNLRDTVGNEDPIMNPNQENNTNLVSGAERAVDGGEPNSLGFHDVMGNAWEWCEDHQAPLPGFQLHPLYDDFTLPCFDGEHNLIMGGSFVSTGDQASVFARYQFRPHFFQHASFRLSQPLSEPWLVTSCMESPGPYARAESPYRNPEDFLEPPGLTPEEPKEKPSHLPDLTERVNNLSFLTTAEQKQSQADYEFQEWVSRYLHLHYPRGDAPVWVPDEALDFPKKCAEKMIETALRLGTSRGKALDLGCGAGGSSFALADKDNGYQAVTGLEYSHAFVDVCNQLKFYGQVDYNLRLEGDQHESRLAVVPSNSDRSRVQFQQGDACCLEETWQQEYDAVLLGNLIDRVPKPRALLYNMAPLVAPKGLLMVTAPFSWKVEFCPREEWLGGHVEGDSSTEAVAQTLDSVGFDPVDRLDMPLVIRHHERFYELIGAEATLWQKREEVGSHITPPQM